MYKCEYHLEGWINLYFETDKHVFFKRCRCRFMLSNKINFNYQIGWLEFCNITFIYINFIKNSLTLKQKQNFLNLSLEGVEPDTNIWRIRNKTTALCKMRQNFNFIAQHFALKFNMFHVGKNLSRCIMEVPPAPRKYFFFFTDPCSQAAVCIHMKWLQMTKTHRTSDFVEIPGLQF